MVKNLPGNAGDTRGLGWIPGSGRSPRVGNSSPLWYCLENPMERGAWWSIVHGVGHKELDMSEHTCTHTSVIYYLSSVVYVSSITYLPSCVSLCCLLSLLLAHSPTLSLFLLPPSHSHSHNNCILFSDKFLQSDRKMGTGNSHLTTFSFSNRESRKLLFLNSSCKIPL